MDLQMTRRSIMTKRPKESIYRMPIIEIPPTHEVNSDLFGHLGDEVSLKDELPISVKTIFTDYEPVARI